MLSSSRFLLKGLLAASCTFAFAADECAIHGQVDGSNGSPSPHAAVTVFRYPLDSFGRPAQVFAGASADADGRFCLLDLPDGIYAVRAGSPSNPPSARPDCRSCCDPATVFAPAFFRQPNSKEAAATPVTLRKGRAAEAVRIALPRVPAYCVRGEVRNRGGKRLVGVGITLRSSDLASTSTVFNGEGRFLLTGLPSGDYDLIVHASPLALGQAPLAQQSVHVAGRNLDHFVIVVP